MTVHPAKTQISLGIRQVWSESLLCAQWVAKDPRFINVDSVDSDQTRWMPRLIWILTGRTCHFVGYVMWWLMWLYCLSQGTANLTEMMCIQRMHLQACTSQKSDQSLLGSVTSHKQRLIRWCDSPASLSLCCMHMGHVMRKCVFGVSDQLSLKPACSAAETS